MTNTLTHALTIHQPYALGNRCWPQTRREQDVASTVGGRGEAYRYPRGEQVAEGEGDAMKRQQQTGRHQKTNKAKRDMKRLQRRAERREGKRAPETAPTRRRFWGYD